MNRVVFVGIKGFCFAFAMIVPVHWLAGDDGFGFPLLFGLAISGAAMISQWRAERAIQTMGARPMSGTVQEKTINLPLTPEEAFNQAKTCLEDMPAIMEITSERLGLRARRSVSGTGWGERITVDCTPGPAGATVRLASRSLWRFHISDFGENQLNVERLAKRLQGSEGDRAKKG
ncbi:MAG: hypothetical protein WED11_07615 [Natronospirillum sp.]